MTTISLPRATLISSYVFDGCSSLTSVYLPQATKIEWRAFDGCGNLITNGIAKAIKIDNKAFANCNKLQYLSIDDITTHINIENLLENLPQILKNKKIILQPEQINGLCIVQELLNQNIVPDVHPHILNFSKRIGFFTKPVI